MLLYRATGACISAAPSRHIFCSVPQSHRHALGVDIGVIRGVKRQIRRMVGEVMREIGVLLVVFAPLDALFSRGTLTVMAIVVIVVVAVLFLVAGIMLGLERQ